MPLARISRNVLRDLEGGDLCVKLRDIWVGGEIASSVQISRNISVSADARRPHTGLVNTPFDVGAVRARRRGGLEGGEA